MSKRAFVGLWTLGLLLTLGLAVVPSRHVRAQNSSARKAGNMLLSVTPAPIFSYTLNLNVTPTPGKPNHAPITVAAPNQVQPWVRSRCVKAGLFMPELCPVYDPAEIIDQTVTSVAASWLKLSNTNPNFSPSSFYSADVFPITGRPDYSTGFGNGGLTTAFSDLGYVPHMFGQSNKSVNPDSGILLQTTNPDGSTVTADTEGGVTLTDKDGATVIKAQAFNNFNDGFGLETTLTDGSLLRTSADGVNLHIEDAQNSTLFNDEDSYDLTTDNNGDLVYTDENGDETHFYEDPDTGKLVADLPDGGSIQYSVGGDYQELDDQGNVIDSGTVETENVDPVAVYEELGLELPTEDASSAEQATAEAPVDENEQQSLDQQSGSEDQGEVMPTTAPSTDNSASDDNSGSSDGDSGG